MVGGRRHRPGDHLSAPELSQLLLDPAEAIALDAHGRTEAAVLVPVIGWPDRPEILFTERRHDLRRHGGEISFPGGRRDPGEELLETALREANEEIALDPAAVTIAGAIEPIGTFVTSYKVHPFVGLIEPGLPLAPNPAEVESVISATVAELRESWEVRRLVRRGVPFRTDVFLAEDKVIWGATARVLRLLLNRIEPLA